MSYRIFGQIAREGTKQYGRDMAVCTVPPKAMAMSGLLSGIAVIAVPFLLFVGVQYATISLATGYGGKVISDGLAWSKELLPTVLLSGVLGSLLGIVRQYSIRRERYIKCIFTFPLSAILAATIVPAYIFFLSASSDASGLTTVMMTGSAFFLFTGLLYDAIYEFVQDRLIPLWYLKNPSLHLLYQLRVEAETIGLHWAALQSAVLYPDKSVLITTCQPIDAEQRDRLRSAVITRGYKKVQFQQA